MMDHRYSDDMIVVAPNSRDGLNSCKIDPTCWTVFLVFALTNTKFNNKALSNETTITIRD